MKRETIETIVADLRAGRVPELVVEDFPAFIIVDDKGNDFFADFKH